MVKIEPYTLIKNPNLKALGIKPVVDANHFVQVQLVSVPDGIDNDLAHRHFDEVGLIRIAPSQGRQVVGDVLDQIGILQIALNSLFFCFLSR